MSDCEFEAALWRILPNACDALDRLELRLCRGGSMSDADVLARAVIVCRRKYPRR